MNALTQISHLSTQSPTLFDVVKPETHYVRTKEVAQEALHHFLSSPDHTLYKLSVKKIYYINSLRPKQPSMTPKQWGVILSVWLVSCCLFYKTKSDILPLIVFQIGVYTSAYFQNLNQQAYRHACEEYELEKEKNCRYGIYLTPTHPECSLPSLQVLPPSDSPISHLEDFQKIIQKWKKEKSFCLLFITNGEKENAKQNLQHLIRDHHLSSQEPYLYSVCEKNIKNFSNEIHNTLQENTVLYLSRKTRPLPKLGSALQDDGSIFDMISQENIPKDTWTSPKHLFLKNHIIHYKDYLNNLFTRGKHKHPFHLKFEEGEKENLILQLTQILQISEKVIEDCLALFLTSEEKRVVYRDKSHLIVTKEGFFTQAAMHKISYSYNVPNNSKAFSEQAFSQFFQHVEALRKICSEHLPATFFSTIHTTVALSYKEVDKLFSLANLLSLNSRLENLVLVIDWAPQQQDPLTKTQCYIRKHWIYHAIFYELLQKVCPNSEKEYVQAYRKLMRASALKEISPPLLFPTGLYKDLKKDALTKKRIEAFERLTGISLARE